MTPSFILASSPFDGWRCFWGCFVVLGVFPVVWLSCLPLNCYCIATEWLGGWFWGVFVVCFGVWGCLGGFWVGVGGSGCGFWGWFGLGWLGLVWFGGGVGVGFFSKMLIT